MTIDGGRGQVRRSGLNGHTSAPAWLLASTRPAGPTAEPQQRRSERDIVQEWGEQSFPASDPPANW